MRGDFEGGGGVTGFLFIANPVRLGFREIGGLTLVILVVRDSIEPPVVLELGEVTTALALVPEVVRERNEGRGGGLSIETLREREPLPEGVGGDGLDLEGAGDAEVFQPVLGAVLAGVADLLVDEIVRMRGGRVVAVGEVKPATDGDGGRMFFARAPSLSVGVAFLRFIALGVGFELGSLGGPLLVFSFL